MRKECQNWVHSSKYIFYITVTLTNLIKIHIQPSLISLISNLEYTMLFSFFTSKLNTVSSYMPQILHHHIAAVEKLPLTTSGCPLVIQCKNFRIVHFVVPRERDCHDIYNSLLQLSKTGEASNCKRLCEMCLGNKLMRKIPCVGFVFEKCALKKFNM